VGQLRWSDAHFGYRVGSPREDLSFDRRDNARGMPKCRVVDPAFTWGTERPPRVPWGETVVYAGDLTKPSAPVELVATAMEAFGQIDIIVNNAGYTLDAPIHKMSDDWFQKMLDIHLIAPFRIIRAAAPHLREPAKQEKAEGQEVFRKIVNVSSTSGTMGNAGQANYSAAKAAVVGLTRTMAKEWGQFKINCNAVAFGYIETRLTASKDDENVMEIDGERVQLGIPDQMRGIAKMIIPLGRPGTPEEAAGGVFFLCSPWSNFVHVRRPFSPSTSTEPKPIDSDASTTRTSCRFVSSWYCLR